MKLRIKNNKEKNEKKNKKKFKKMEQFYNEMYLELPFLIWKYLNTPESIIMHICWLEYSSQVVYHAHSVRWEGSVAALYIARPCLDMCLRRKFKSAGRRHLIFRETAFLEADFGNSFQSIGN